MKIVFVNLSDYNNIYDGGIPLGILSLATIISKETDYHVGIIDFCRLYYDKEIELHSKFLSNINENCNYILNQEPDIISLYTMCNNFHVALLVAKEIKNRNKNITILLGGPHATAVAKSTLKKFGYIDAIGLGEGEKTIVSIIEGCTQNSFLNSKGIAYKKEDKIIVNEYNELLENLDEIPMLDYSLYPHTIKGNLNIDIGRGCPFSCSFCSTKTFWKRKFRMKSSQRILNEILYAKNQLGISSFGFEHDLFMTNHKLVKEICDHIIQRNLDITWGCSSRLDTINEQLIIKMKEAGCKNIYFGVETGSENLQKLINKNLKISQLNNVVSLLNKHNIKATYSFIYGFPQETETDLEYTLSAIYSIYNQGNKLFKKNLVTVQFHKLLYFPSTELTDVYFNSLQKQNYYGLEVSLGKKELECEEIVKMIEEKEIFPQYFYYSNELIEKTKLLDIFINMLVNPLLYLFEGTYRLLLNEMQGKHLFIYYEFHHMFSEQIFYEIKDLYKIDRKKYKEKVLSTFESFISTYQFKYIEESLIKTIFLFEKEIMLGKVMKDGENKNITYPYDIIEIRNKQLTHSPKKATTVIMQKRKGILQVIKEDVPLLSIGS